MLTTSQVEEVLTEVISHMSCRKGMISGRYPKNATNSKCETVKCVKVPFFPFSVLPYQHRLFALESTSVSKNRPIPGLRYRSDNLAIRLLRPFESTLRILLVASSALYTRSHSGTANLHSRLYTTGTKSHLDGPLSCSSPESSRTTRMLAKFYPQPSPLSPRQPISMMSVSMRRREIGWGNRFEIHRMRKLSRKLARS